MNFINHIAINKGLTTFALKIFSVSFASIRGLEEGFQSGGWAEFDAGGLLESFFTILLGALTTFGGVAFLLYFIFGSYSWLTSQGDAEKISKAQRYITNAIIGLILLVATWAVTGIIGLIVGFDILDLAANITTYF